MDASNAVSKSESTPPSPPSEPGLSTSELVPLLIRLCTGQEAMAKAIRKQARAIDRLAASNEELVDALMQDDGGEEGDAPKLDLAGRPLDS